MNLKRIFAWLSIAVVVFGVFFIYGRTIWYPIYLKFLGHRTVEEAVAEYSPRAELSLKTAFSNVGSVYPPSGVVLIAFKKEMRLELWGNNQDKWNFVSEYKIKAASGRLGPKLKKGDRQVPEGIYRIIGLNPNSSFHLSMKLNYPNDFDQFHAKEDGRVDLGRDIFIHGKSASIGCLAMGDEVAEQLFILVNKVGLTNIKVIIAPYDFRKTGILIDASLSPPWLPELYKTIYSELKKYDR